MKLIDKDALVAEIEKKWKYDQGFQTEDETKAYQRCCDDILYVIKTLEVKEVDLDFTKEVDMWVRDNGDTNGFFNVQDLAKHFFNLGIAASNKALKGE